MCNDSKFFTQLSPLSNPLEVKLGDGHPLTAEARGTVKLSLKCGRNRYRKCNLYEVLYVPKLSCNLLSVSKTTERGNEVKFSETSCVIRDSSHKPVVIATRIGDLHQITTEDICANAVSTTMIKEDLWHRRYGHLSLKNLQKLAREQLVYNFDFSATKEIQFCEPCLHGKQHREPFPDRSESRSNEALDIVHSDVCGKLNTKSLSGAEYFLTFIDDKTRYTWVYILKRKSEVFDKFRKWKAQVECSTGKTLKVLRTDNGGEFTSTEFEEYLKNEGVKHELTVPKCPQQNGVAERLNRTLVEMVRSMLSGASLPQRFWAEALATAVYLRNRCPTKAVIDKTPIEALTGSRPSVKHLRVFGCVAYRHVPKDERRKLDSKTEKCIFLGYSDTRKGYRLYNTQKMKIVYSRDVVFNEMESMSWSEKESDGHPLVRIELVDTDQETDNDQKVQNESTSDESSQDESNRDSNTESRVTERRSTRERRRPDYYGVYVNLVSQVSEPNTVNEALKGTDSQKWIEAMKTEMQSLNDNHVWELVDAPEKARIVNCKWIFKCKLKENGQVERYKARLVAQGFSQRPRIDYEETFSPVVRFESVRTVLAVAAEKNWKIHQMDVTTAFLNGELNESVYMRQPEGYVEQGKENMVCKLKKSIYGLKQSPRCWNSTLDTHLQNMGFMQMKSDPCLYLLHELILAVYVDDILICGRTDQEIEKVKSDLARRFNIKDLGELKYFLGVNMVQNVKHSQIWIGQPMYTELMIKEFEMLDAKTAKSPVNPSLKLKKASTEDIPVNQEMYQSAVGKLLYLAIRTRPDIAYAVSSVARFTTNPTEEHWKAVKHIFRYLLGTMYNGIQYSQTGKIECKGYSDADWGGDLDDRKSTSGYVFQIGGGPVSWQSRKQGCVAISTSEAEYIALTSAAQEGIWLCRLLDELTGKQTNPIVIYEDNQSAICLSKNPQFHGRSKHIDIKFHFIRDRVKEGTIVVEYCRSEDMLADMYTKGLYGEKFKRLRNMNGILENALT